MKKLYRKGGTVHPSPCCSSSSSSLSLSFLPAAILSLAATLSVDDKQVLAYLLSCSATTPFDSHPSNSNSSSSSSSSNKKHLKNNTTTTINSSIIHPTAFSCYCFTCYTSYWSRWDSSPNRQLIHEIIDAFEDHLLEQNKNNNKHQGLNNNNKKKKKNVNGGRLHMHLNSQASRRLNSESTRPRSVEQHHHADDDDDAGGDNQGSVRKMVTFLWANVWG